MKKTQGGCSRDRYFEQPATFELAINAGTARALGIAVPASMPARASLVIQ